MFNWAFDPEKSVYTIKVVLLGVNLQIYSTIMFSPSALHANNALCLQLSQNGFEVLRTTFFELFWYNFVVNQIEVLLYSVQFKLYSWKLGLGYLDEFLRRVFIKAKISVRSPGKLFIFII